MKGGTVARVLLKVLYWVAVLAISLALLIALVLYFESRDESTLEEEVRLPAPVALIGLGR